nr:hypothetical protein CFP56_00108 [Quercus suber]
MDQVILDGLQNLQLTKEEEEGIQITAASRAECLEECHLSLFGKLLSDRQQNLRALKSTLRSVWKMGSDLRIVDVGNDILQFKFNSKYQMEWVEKNGPWNFDNNLLLLCRWKKGLTVTNIVFSHSSFWVQIWGVPFELRVEETGRDIGNRMGKFIEADKRAWQSEQARHCDATEPGQTTERQYGEWIRANGSAKGGLEKMKMRKEMSHQSSKDERRPVEQPIWAEPAMGGSGEGSRSGTEDWSAEKQNGTDDVGNDGRTASQAAGHSGGWDNSAVSPPNAEMSELTRIHRKGLNFENNGGKRDAPGMGQSIAGCQSGRILEEMEVTSPVKPNVDFSEYKDDGFLDLGHKTKDLRPKTIGSWKRLAREKGLTKEEDVMGQEKRSGIKRTGELEELEAEENRNVKRKQKKNTKETAVTAVQHRREP